MSAKTKKSKKSRPGATPAPQEAQFTQTADLPAAEPTVAPEAPAALPMPIPGLIGKLQWPKPGATFALPTGYGSSDALQLAALASREDRSGTLTILSASAVDAQRLHEEIGFFAPALTTRLFPDWEILPYDVLSPHQDLVSERLATLYSLHREDVDILICPVTTAVHRLAPPAFLSSTTFYFDKGAVLNEAGLRKQLTHAGYEHVSQVVRPGEYSVRGGLIDLFPMGAELPFRLDLFGDEIESIRTFNPESQRSLYPVQNVRLLPAREVPTDEASRNNFRNRWRERFEGDPSRCALYKDIANGIFGAGIEYYLPLFHEETADIFHYLPEGSTIVFHGDVSETIDDFLTDAKSRYSFLSHDAERPLLKPTEVFLTGEEFFGEVKRFGRINISARPSTDLIGASDQAGPDSPPGQTPSVPLDSSSGVPTPYAMALPDVSVDRRAASPVSRIHALIQTRRQQPAQSMARILVMAESEGRLETLVQLFGEYELKLPVKSSWADWADSADIAAMVVGPLHDGFHCDDGLVTLITEAELFTGSARRARRGKREATTDVNAIIRDLSELKIGDPVVHIEHGIGRYEGLIDMDIGEGTMEFLHLTYAKESMLYVPVSQLHLISRYSGANPDEAPLHQLGSGQWEKARKKAAKQARDTAAELLNLYARRAARVGHAFEFSASDYAAFADGFGFEETPDQLAAIHAVVQDMISDKPMDRLVCGDVGFGKTEVALRAAFLAVSGGRQVVLLAPTTLLAEQHFATFSDRFAHWPIKVAQLSRFRSGKEIKAALAGLADGSVDIVIGTHKLLSSDVKLKRLGLAIIDEEHRFGVRQKERLKALRAEVDVLTLTATPIPRTLAMSLEGIRDFSVIATAPQRRLAIKTFVRPEARSVVREALLRELKRGGQVYYLHNEVQTINTRRDTLAELVPEARIAVAHGQMGERDLERVMRDFHQQRFNVLLCPTIIETGIDVPTANTIVIHRADKFGLAQLHQLRGRVGRSHHQAYAYLLTPHEGGITRDAGKRLEAIQSMEELGAGFFLSMHDLEIRGSGEVLGDNQSGDMQQIGFSLYAEMLDEAVRSLKAGKEPDLEAPLASTTEINLHMPALLPADYCPDIHERLTLYKRLANCSDDNALIRMSEELIDRFGRLPEPARALVDTHRLRVLSRPIGVNKIDASEQAIVIQFIAQPPIEPSAIIAFMQSRKDTRLAGADRIRVSVESPDLQQRVQRIREIISALKREAESADKTDATDKTDETK